MRDLGKFIKFLIGVAMFIFAAVFVALLALGVIGKGWHYPWDPKPATVAPLNATTSEIIDQANALVVAPEDCGAGYDRDAFGDFTDETYAKVVARAAQVDQWTGRPLTKADRPQVDHIVPVHDAACSGLTADQYAAFYNDTDNLVLTAGKVNAGKSDKAPGEWEAPNGQAMCQFADAWVLIKTKWHLTADPQEMLRLTVVLASCHPIDRSQP